MARKRTTTQNTPPDAPGGERIVDTDVVSEMRQSFLEYSMSVIVARALPDVRDGLKPVHRRILYTLHEQGNRPNTAHVKCAKVVGATMGSYHPHGDSAIYEALVRLSQDFAMRLPLVDGHGNFGSLDDGPAAARYTECRMAPGALLMCDELGENTVDFKPNYDGTEQEPTVLPAAFPNLLVNGASGIAVGMATNMAPHNLTEVVAGLQAMIANPKITLAEMMRFIPGPDFPTGTVVYDNDAIKEAYRTGRGVLKMRAVARIEQVSARRQGIVVTELPHMVGPEKVIAKIKDLVNAKKLLGIADVKDLSDRVVGLKLVIEVKTGFNPEAVLEELYRLTPLEDSFAINNVALVHGDPRTLGLLELCSHYIEHRTTVVRRRTQHRLDKAKAREHIVEGLVVALTNIDEVVRLLKASKDADTARQKLIKQFQLSETQANHILEMPLRRLTGLEISKLRDELKDLKRTITELAKLLGSDKRLREQVAVELAQVSEAYGTPRRSRLLATAPIAMAAASTTSEKGGAQAALEIPDEPCLVTLTTGGLIGRYSAGQPGGKSAKGDLVVASLLTRTRASIGAVTDSGRLVKVQVLELPACDAKNRGGGVGEFVELAAGESIVALCALEGHTIALGTSAGVVKRIEAGQLPRQSGTIVALKEGDRVVGARSLPQTESDRSELVFVTSDAQLLRFAASQVRPQGSNAGGMAGVRLGEDAHVVAFCVVAAGEAAKVHTATDAATVKTSALSDYPAKGRATGGVRATTFRKADGRLVAALVGAGRAHGVSSSGDTITLPAQELRRDAAGEVLDTQVSSFAVERAAFEATA